MINYRGVLTSGYSDSLSADQVDSFSLALTAGTTYIFTPSSPQVINLALVTPTSQVIANENVSSGTQFTYTPQVSGVYGLGVETALGTPGLYTIFTASYTPAYELTPPIGVTAHTWLTPSPDFDTNYYLAQNPDVLQANVDPVVHYASFGWQEGRNPDAYFNTEYYLRQNPDVAAAGIDPLTHYEQFGWREGRDPSANFSTDTYLLHNPDVAAAGVDPLAQYLHYGIAEGRMAFLAQPHGVGPQNALVDNAYYFAQYPDVAAAGENPFTHYDTIGWHEGRNPDALFDTTYYLQQNPDVKAAGIDPLLHYETSGWMEGRNPSADFSTEKYLAANPDVMAAKIDPLVHYELYGMAEGRLVFHV